VARLAGDVSAAFFSEWKNREHALQAMIEDMEFVLKDGIKV
jgi:hypothetical protein